MGNKWVGIKKRKTKQKKKKKCRREKFRYYQMQVRTMIKVSGTRICMRVSNDSRWSLFEGLTFNPSKIILSIFEDSCAGRTISNSILTYCIN